MNTYDIFEGEKLKIAEKIQQRRLQLLVHSCLYYELDTNIIDDNTWNKWANELADLQNKHSEIAKQVKWYEIFRDWDGSTGAFLPLQDDWVLSKARKLLQIKENAGVTVKQPKKSKASQLVLF